MENKTAIIIMRGKIKGLALEGQRTRKFINVSEKDVKDGHWKIKRAIGQDARYHLIAYGLLRGREYRTIERCAEDNRPHASTIESVLRQHLSLYEMRQWTVAKIENLLVIPDVEQPQDTSIEDQKKTTGMVIDETVGSGE